MMKRQQRVRVASAWAISMFFAIAFALPAGAAMSACTATIKRDTSQLSAQGLSDLKKTAVVKLVNDATTAAIAANKAGVLTDANERTVLTINKQVLDYFQADPHGTLAQALAIVRNARQALPPAVDAAIATWIQKTIDALLEVQ